MRGKLGIGLVATVVVGSLCGQVSAQVRVELGRAIARDWCSACHLIEPGGSSGSDIAPPFPLVAQRPTLTADQLRAWLTDPHPPMPNLNLTRAEIEALVAYILSLRSE